MSEGILILPPPEPEARIAYGEDPNQFGELRLPRRAGPHPVVIFLHGGFWRAAYDLGYAGHLCAALAEAGYATWSLEYRRIGQPGRGWPGTMDNVRSGALHLRNVAPEHGLDLSRIVVAGHSAGGHWAPWLAAQQVHALERVAALAAVSDLRRAAPLGLGGGIVERFLGGSPDEVSQRYRSASPMPATLS